jgi:hypothetical protein
MQTVIVFFLYLNFFIIVTAVFSIIIQYVSIAAVPYRVQQYLNLCCATIQGGTAIYLIVLCGCGITQGATAKIIFFPIVVAAAPHRVQQQNATMKVFSANRVVKATTKICSVYIVYFFFSLCNWWLV